MLQRDRIVYNSFQGRFSDNPRAIYEELARRGVATTPVWMAREPRLDDFPSGAVTAAPGTPELLREVDPAKYIVANVESRKNLPVKHPETVFLQTCHGTP